MKKYLYCLFAALLLLSCGKEVDPPDPVTPPMLVSVSPADGTADLTGTSLSIVFTYDQNIKVLTADYGKVTVSGGASVSKVNAYAKALTVDVEGLEQGKTYTVSIPSGIVQGYKDNQGAAEAASTSFTMKEFKTYGMNPQKTLTNAKASVRAKALYQFLLDNYGKKTLSGTMACKSGWDNQFADHINSITGKYPAILGYDYLFMEWPPKAWADCPDYGDISDVKKAWDDGSIIQICWHWNVPKSEEVFRKHDPGEYAFYTSANKAFHPKDALKEGTWQHECMDAQIEKLAGYLKLLSDADIPVLFRPLHEAAGDYTWGPWFWWGLDGAEPCRQLWRYLYDKLTGTYALNNLVWVWTIQTSDEGKLAETEKMEAWYPGDDCVDLVGCDLYVDKNTTQSATFKRVNDSVKGNKMVALCEIGNLFDFDACYAEGAPWLYFLTWNNFVDGKPALYADSWNNSVDDWKKALSNTYMLNRGSVTNWK